MSKIFVLPSDIKHGNGKSSINGGFDRKINEHHQQMVHVPLPGGHAFLSSCVLESKNAEDFVVDPAVTF